MTVVTLTVEETALGGPEGAERGAVTVDYVAGAAGFVEVDGSTVTLPKTVTVEFVDGVLADPLDLAPTGGVCAARITIRSWITGQTLRRFVTIPPVGPVAFGSLTDVDPGTFTPTTLTPTLAESIDQRVAQYMLDNPSDPAVIEAAVDAFLTANPPVTGVEHVQAVAAASWLIPHTLGRRPAVTVYVGGEEVIADVTATATSVSVAFANPTAGSAVLN